MTSTLLVRSKPQTSERLFLLNPMPLDLAVERRPINTHNPGAAGNIPIIVRQYLPDVDFFYLFEGIIAWSGKRLMTEYG